MLELFFSLCIIILMVISIFFLYYQYKVYREQKELIQRESKAIRMLRDHNLEALRSRFRLSQVRVKS